MHPDLCFLSATELARLIRTREVSCEEVMRAHLEQIERVNPMVTAIVTLLPERALDGARMADRAIASGQPLGPLHGLPVAHKDLLVTKGIRTTFGSPIYRDFVPDTDAILVERFEVDRPPAIGPDQARVRGQPAGGRGVKRERQPGRAIA